MFNGLFSSNNSDPQSGGLLDAFSSPEMAFAASLLQSAGPSLAPSSLGQAVAGGYAAMQKAQQARDEIQRRKQLADIKQKLGESELAKNQFTLQQGQQANELAQQRMAQVNQLMGQEPSMVNNFKGTGYLGGEISGPELYNRLGLINMAAGDPKTGVTLLDAGSTLNAGPNPVNMTAEQKNARALGLTPGTEEYNNYIRSFSPESKQQNELSVIGQRAISDTSKDRIKDISGSLNAVQPIYARIEKINNTLEKVSNDQLGAVKTRLGFLNPDIQSLRGDIDSLIPDLRVLKAFPGGNFSNLDVEKLASNVANLNTDKQVIVDSIAQLKKELKIREDRARTMLKAFNKVGDLREFDQQDGQSPSNEQASFSLAPLTPPGYQGGLLGPGVAPPGTTFAGQPITKVKSYSAFGR